MATRKATLDEEAKIVTTIEAVDAYLYDMAEAMGLTDGEVLTVLSNLLTEAAAMVGVPEDELIDTTRLLFRLKLHELAEEESLPDLIH